MPMGCYIRKAQDNIRRGEGVKAFYLNRHQVSGWNRELLYALYWDKGKSLSQIATILNTSVMVIWKMFKDYRIPCRNKHDHNAMRYVSDPTLRQGTSTKGKKHSPEACERKRAYWKAYYERNPKALEDRLHRMHVGQQPPTKPELKLDELLSLHFPNQFKYNGDYGLGISLNRLIPDFVNVNGKKQVIELLVLMQHSVSR